MAATRVRGLSSRERKKALMKLHQLSLFLENKSGQLSAPCHKLAEANINILTMSLADTQQFGILRLIVDDWEKARKVLEDSGMVVNLTDVIGIEVFDKPGGLDKLLTMIEECDLNVEYMYAFTFGQDNKAVIIFRFEDVDAAIPLLKARGVSLVDIVKLSERMAH